ncbi:TPA: tyrosine-type recombinase/integrase, partial [Salmonella enterica subsp. enterica serovar Enteritidis]
MSLTDSKIRAAKPSTKSYKLTDSQGLYLVISASGSRLWYFRYSFSGKESRLSLGSYPHVTLAEAREKRDASHKKILSGINPSQQRNMDKKCITETNTFKSIATSWHTSNKKHWSEHHANKIMVCLERYVFPHTDTMNIQEIETRHLAELVRAVDDNGVHDVAGRIRQYLTKIMRHAVQQGI